MCQPLLIATPATSEEESVAHVTISAASVDESANPPTPSKTTGDVRSPTESEYHRGVKVHSSHMAPSVGSIPCNPGDLRWCHHNHSSSQHKRAWHLLEEEQQALRPSFKLSFVWKLPRAGTPRGGRPGSKTKGATSRIVQEIARSLTASKSPKMEDDSPWNLQSKL